MTNGLPQKGIKLLMEVLGEKATPPSGDLLTVPRQEWSMDSSDFATAYMSLAQNPHVRALPLSPLGFAVHFQDLTQMGSPIPHF